MAEPSGNKSRLVAAFDPAAMEAKVADNMAEIKDIIAETGKEAKMLAKFVKPVRFSDR